MSTRKTIGGALGAIIVLIVAQILAQLVASLFVLVKIPEGICNIIAGIIYVGLAFVLSELFSKRLLKIKIESKRLIFRYDRKNPRLLFSSRSTLTVHI